MCTGFEYAPGDSLLEGVEDRFGSALRVELSGFPPSHDARPMHYAPIIRWLIGQRPHAVLARWGFIPPWVLTDQVRPEVLTHVEQAPSQAHRRYAWCDYRCLVPVTAWYQAVGDHGCATGDDADGPQQELIKRTLRVGSPEGEIFMLAGLHGYLETLQGRRETFSILTRPAPRGLDPALQRVPCVVERRTWNAWLYPFTKDPGRFAGMLAHTDMRLEIREGLRQTA